MPYSDRRQMREGEEAGGRAPGFERKIGERVVVADTNLVEQAQVTMTFSKVNFVVTPIQPAHLGPALLRRRVEKSPLLLSRDSFSSTPRVVAASARTAGQTSCTPQ